MFRFLANMVKGNLNWKVTNVLGITSIVFAGLGNIGSSACSGLRPSVAYKRYYFEKFREPLLLFVRSALW